MAVDVLICGTLDEGKTIRTPPHDWTIFIMECGYLVHLVALDQLKGVGEVEGCP